MDQDSKHSGGEGCGDACLFNALFSTDEVVGVCLKEKRVSGIHVTKADPLTKKKFSCDKVVSTKNKEWMSKFLDELQAKKKNELEIAAAPASKVEPAAEKKGWI